MLQFVIKGSKEVYRVLCRYHRSWFKILFPRRCKLNVRLSPFQVEWPITEKAWRCLSAERARVS